LAALACVGLLGATANADTQIDLTHGGSGTLNGAVYTTAVIQPAGTGVIYSFVRLQAPGRSTVEEGYNTDGRLYSPVRGPFDELTDPNFTRSLTVGQIPVVSYMGTDYRLFHLDINEPSQAAKSTILLANVRLYISPTGNSTTTNLNDGGPLGTLIYAMDAGMMNNSVLLDANYFGPPGSGTSDMSMLVPASLFPDDPSAYVTLYSKFTDAQSRHWPEAGFEEWFTQFSPQMQRIAEPTALMLLGCGLGYLAVRRRRRVSK